MQHIQKTIKLLLLLLCENNNTNLFVNFNGIYQLDLQLNQF